MTNNQPCENRKWWSYGHVWLVIGLPLSVVVASFITLYLAVSRPNEILSVDAYSSPKQSDQTPGAGSAETGNVPALIGRNHAATGAVPKEK
jgi:hypothetical protein